MEEPFRKRLVGPEFIGGVRVGVGLVTVQTSDGVGVGVGPVLEVSCP